MKVSVASPEFEITVTDDSGKVVLCYHATDYRFEADSIGFIKAVEEHIPAIKALAEKIDNA